MNAAHTAGKEFVVNDGIAGSLALQEICQRCRYTTIAGPSAGESVKPRTKSSKSDQIQLLASCRDTKRRSENDQCCQIQIQRGRYRGCIIADAGMLDD